ncbi:MAG: hypothetical protein AAGE96_11890 [Cyanobacteria bacterium P01_G01_bin.19]
MFSLGDKPSGMASQRVKHIETDNIGIVIGFGKRIVNNKCLSAVKVKTISSESNKKITVKDLQTQWLPCSEDYKVIHPNLNGKKLILAPIKRYDRPKIA